MKITVETPVRASIDAVWKAYITPEDIVQWNAASDDWHTTRSSVDLRVGGKSFGFDFAGTYTKIEPNRLIEYSFGDRKATVEFVEGTDAVTVRVTFDAEETHPVEQQRGGWQAILDKFRRHVEGGS